MKMKQNSILQKYGLLILSGLVIGAAAIVLTLLGNPKNMGICTACFLRDISGGLNLQRAGFDAETGTGIVQYIRPEIIGIVLGSTIMAAVKKEFRPKGGSSSMVRFLLGIFVMIGALVFLGCPLRMVIRLGSGDLNALVGLVGFVAGVLVGTIFLNRGFSLKRSYRQSVTEGGILPGIMVVLLVLLVTGSTVLQYSVTGPGSQHAPIAIALVIGLVIGALLQRSRMCMVGGIRDIVLFRDFRLISAFIMIILTVLVGNLLVGNGIHFSFADQPIAHSDGLWNLLGMAMVGWGCTLLGGCPLRQLILAGEGNTDSAVTIMGFIVGAAISHNFGLASSADGIGPGPVAVTMILGFVVLAAVSFANLEKIEV